MLRGTATSTAAFSLEQATDATGAVQQVKLIQPLTTDRVLSQDDQALGAARVARVATVDVNVESVASAAAQLYPFVTEKAPSTSGGSAPQVQPLEAAQHYQDESDAKTKKETNVELPLDPLDPTWGKPSDRDRTLNAAADFGVPSRLLLQNSNDEKTIALLSGVSAITTMAAESSDILQQQFPMLLVGGMVAFVVAGVVVNRARRSNEKKNKQKAFDDDVVFDDDDECDNEEGYALFS